MSNLNKILSQVSEELYNAIKAAKLNNDDSETKQIEDFAYSSKVIDEAIALAINLAKNSLDKYIFNKTFEKAFWGFTPEIVKNPGVTQYWLDGYSSYPVICLDYSDTYLGISGHRGFGIAGCSRAGIIDDMINIADDYDLDLISKEEFVDKFTLETIQYLFNVLIVQLADEVDEVFSQISHRQLSFFEEKEFK